MLTYLKHLTQIILSPANGWEDISHAGVNPDTLRNRGLIPLLAIAALTSFVQMAYRPDLGLIIPLERAIVIFTMYFLTLYLAVYFFPMAIRDSVSTDVNTTRVNTFIIYSLGLMALVTIIENVMTMQMSIMKFLPIFIILIMWKGMRYLDILSSRQLQFVAAYVILIIIPPILLQWVLNLVIPQN